MNKRIIMIIVSTLIIFGIIMGIYYLISKKQEIYNTTYGFAFGSRRVKVYDNGDVYDDLEVEDPNHEEKYTFVVKLSKEDLKFIKERINDESKKDEIDKFIIKTVYGVARFGNMGEY